MWTIINGVDVTDYIPKESLAPKMTIGDQLPTCECDILDIGSLMSYDTGQEVIIFNENAAPTKTVGGNIILTTPAHNILRRATALSDNAVWATGGTLSGLITLTFQLSMTFNNAAVGTGYVTQTSLYGYIHEGQTYMLSAYTNGSGTINNIRSFMQLQWLDAGSNPIGSPVVATRTPTISTVRFNLTSTAPAGAVYAQIQLGGQTINATNSGTLTMATPQFEPMWFAARGVSYPTPDCNFNQVNSAIMPDGTISRACRIFAGYIDDLEISHDENEYAEGPSRTWHVQMAGIGAILENSSVTAAFTATNDDDIISSVVTANFGTWLNVTSAANISSAPPLSTGVLVDSISFNENSLRDVLNSLCDLSGYTYYVDWYGTLYYLPTYYSLAPFLLTDMSPDGINTFPYYNYNYKKDATQQKWDITVIGGLFIAPAITDSFTGNGSNKTFNLSQQPYNVQSCTVGGTGQKVGVAGRDKNGVNGIQALYNKIAKQLIFNTAPGNAVAVAITYTFEAPVAVEVIDSSIARPVSPAYALPPFQSKVTDTNITSLAAATTRGLQELNANAKPHETITCSAQQYAYVGQLIYFTASKENIVNQPYVVQEVDVAILGNGTNEFNYTLGFYQPKFTDRSRNIHKATVRSTTTASVDVILQTDLVISELTNYSETITVTPIGTGAGALVYGTGHWGSNAW